MHPAVHGAELWALVAVEAIVAPLTIIAAIAYVRIALRAGKESADA